MNIQVNLLLRHVCKLTVAHATDRLSDRELLRRFAVEHNEAAFEALVRAMERWSCVCQRVLNHEQDAEDVFQATFLVLTRKAPLEAGRSRWVAGCTKWPIDWPGKPKAGRSSGRVRESGTPQQPPAADPLDEVSVRERTRSSTRSWPGCPRSTVRRWSSVAWRV